MDFTNSSYLEVLNDAILIAKDDGLPVGSISDGCHTFEELYYFRMLYNAALFNEWVKQGLYDVHKSCRHNDGEKCFGSDNWFIVVANLPSGQITNHYKKEYWSLFKTPVVEKAKYEFDGHTAKDVIFRLEQLLINK